MAVLYGIHAVEEALAAGRPLERLLVARGRGGPRAARLVAAARERDVPVRFVSREEVKRLAGSEHHQGVVAVTSARAYAELEDLLTSVAPGDDLRTTPALFVVLDGVEDPHNLGAIIRTAHCAGADGVILPERRAAGLTATAAKAAAGAAEHLPVARVTNLARALQQLKEAGCWTIGLDAQAPQTYTELDLTVPCALVLGSEGSGLHALVRERCDLLASIPVAGAVGSLNVSVAAGIVLYEAVRQRRARGLTR